MSKLNDDEIRKIGTRCTMYAGAMAATMARDIRDFRFGSPSANHMAVIFVAQAIQTMVRVTMELAAEQAEEDGQPVGDLEGAIQAVQVYADGCAKAYANEAMVKPMKRKRKRAGDSALAELDRIVEAITQENQGGD